MNRLLILTSCGLTAILLVGCATQKQVAAAQGTGTKAVYTATYDQVWRACIDAAQRDGLQVTESDRNAGYIAARRTVRPHTFGENVGIWLRSTANPVQTEVEVLSRQAGPPVAWIKNWESDIQRAIAANLTREVYGAAPRGVYVDPQPQPFTTAPAVAPPATVLVPRETAAEREQMRLIDALRNERTRREQELQIEKDPSRREAISRQLSTLDNDIRLEERRLSDLQRAR